MDESDSITPPNETIHNTNDVTVDESVDRNENSNILLTPPPPIIYSPINNIHINFAKKVLEDSRKIAGLKESNKSNKVSCTNCKKLFVRINAHKCKAIKLTP